VVAEKGAQRRRGLGGVDEVELLVPCELHGISRKLLVVTGGTESVPTGLSMGVQHQWRTVTQRGGDPTTENRGKSVKSVHNHREHLGEEDKHRATHRRRRILTGGQRRYCYLRWGKVIMRPTRCDSGDKVG
jgi:hypothetical protein